MIPFNRPAHLGSEDAHVLAAMRGARLSGDGEYGRRCQEWFERDLLKGSKTLLTPSCTQALEMAAMLLGLAPDDEVIMPSFTFVSTANAFVLRGAKVVFVDIRPDTMNIDERLIEAAVTSRTRAIVPVHYAGVGCAMDPIMATAERHGLLVVEDAAQAMMSTYRGRPLGGIGHLGAYSFHETKNFTSGGEGGLLILRDQRYVHRAEIVREKGTNRSQFFRGMIDKYTWVDVGSSYLPSEIQAAYLLGQLEQAERINADRIASWERYERLLRPLADRGDVEIPRIPPECCHNGHMFYIKVKDIEVRTKLLAQLKRDGILAVFHYVPLHTSPAGLRYGRFHGEDVHTTRESERLLRLPMWFGLDEETAQRVVASVNSFFCL